jgi:hypothetical protein
MSGKVNKLLRKGATHFKLPINKVKQVFKNASPESKKKFLTGAKKVQI